MNKNEGRGYLNEDFRIFFLKDTSSLDIDYHYHDFYKIVISLSGNSKYVIEEKTYNLNSGDIVLVNKNELHKCVSKDNEPYDRVVIWIKSDIEDNIYFKNITKCFDDIQNRNNNLIRCNIDKISELKDMLNEIKKHYKSDSIYNDTLIFCNILKLLIYINEMSSKYKSTNSSNDISYDEVTSSIMNYINRHIYQDIKIEDISYALSLNKHYIMRRFKKYTGYSIHNYILNKKIALSVDFMKQNYCMYEISEILGFNDYSTFNRAFKKIYGISPLQYNDTRGSFGVGNNLID